LRLTEGQAQRLGVEARTQVSPHLQRYCLIQSANESYEHAALDLEILTGIKISKSAQHRLVHRVSFADLKVEQGTVEELSADDGRVRLRTPLGKISEWKDYKVITLHTLGLGAAFQDNAALTGWVNRQSLAMPLTCLGDGHPGIWNLMDPLRLSAVRFWIGIISRKICTRFRGSLNRLERVESHLWKGHVDAAIAAFKGCTATQIENFKAISANPSLSHSQL
jgi:hypothetical protein